MPDRSRKRPRDLNKLAASIVDDATNEDKPEPGDDGKDPAAVSLGRRGGLKGGKARAEKLSAEERSEISGHGVGDPKQIRVDPIAWTSTVDDGDGAVEGVDPNEIAKAIGLLRESDVLKRVWSELDAAAETGR